MLVNLLAEGGQATPPAVQALSNQRGHRLTLVIKVTGEGAVIIPLATQGEAWPANRPCPSRHAGP
jgi:hypothetical protein